MVRTAGWALLAMAALYGAVCLLAFAFQRRLLHFPDRYLERDALAAAARLGLSPWRDAKGSLAGWRAIHTGGRSAPPAPLLAPAQPLPDGPALAPPVDRPAARLLVLHGNAGSALDRLHYAAAFSRLGVEVILLEYPGYGARPGSPALGSLGTAAAEALDQLAREGPEPVWVLGESLGTGVAARAVALRPGLVKGLVLVTPFARMADVVRLHFPILPSVLLLDRYAPEADLAAWDGPTAVLLAGRDEVVGVAQGRRLYQALRGPKRLRVDGEATHNGLDLDPAAPFWSEVVALLASPRWSGPPDPARHP